MFRRSTHGCPMLNPQGSLRTSNSGMVLSRATFRTLQLNASQLHPPDKDIGGGMRGGIEGERVREEAHMVTRVGRLYFPHLCMQLNVLLYT